MAQLQEQPSTQHFRAKQCPQQKPFKLVTACGGISLAANADQGGGPCLELAEGAPGPVRADTEQPVKRLRRIAATKHHSLALQADHAVPVAWSWRGAHHIEAVPGQRHGVQHKDIVHEPAGCLGVTPPEYQHEVGAPHHSCMVGPGAWHGPGALRTGPEAGAEGQDMHICQALGGAVDATEDNEGV